MSGGVGAERLWHNHYNALLSFAVFFVIVIAVQYGVRVPYTRMNAYCGFENDSQHTARL